MKLPHIRTDSSGKTLLEICMATGLLSLLAGISAPQLKATQEHIQVKGITSQISELASQLPVIANQQGVELILRKSGDKLSLSSLKTRAAIIRQIHVPPAVSLNINTQGQKISVYPSGVVSPGKIIVTNKKRRCSVTISLWGRVRSACQ